MRRVNFSGSFKLIVISHPDFMPQEAEQIISLFDAGLEILHLRKPEAGRVAYERLLCAIPPQYHERIMLHGFFELTGKYNVRGVHLNRRNPVFEGSEELKISKSCHLIQELENIDSYDYVFLSPVFDSISKEGYGAAFSDEELFRAAAAGLINERVFALGGIDSHTLLKLKRYAFGGAALLGTIWNGISPVGNFRLMCKTLGLNNMQN